MKQKRWAASLMSAAILMTTATACGGTGSTAENYTWSNVAIGGGGYVTGMVYNTGEKDLVYARTDIGGLYRRSARDNDTWQPLTDFLGSDNWNYIGVESVAADPVEPNRVYFAGGTYMDQDGAMFASDDYGETWTQVDVPFSCGGNQSGRGTGERLMVNPNDNKEVWMGTRNAGLWKTADYGKTWEECTSFPVKGNYSQEGNNIGIMWVEFDPGSADMYVGVAMTDGVCIYKTSDGGSTWEALPANEKGMYPLQADISPNGEMYLVYSDNCGPNLSPTAGKVYRYELESGTFTDITPDLDDGRYGGFGGVSVDAQHPDTLVVSTLGWWSDSGDNLYYSTDRGESWSGLFNDKTGMVNYQMDTSQCGWLDWGRGENQAKTGWWMADININPFNSDEIMYGTGATIYSTTNMTKYETEPVTIAFDAYGLEETAVYQMVSPPAQEGAPELYSIMGDLTGFAHMDVTKCPDDAHFMKNGNPTDLDVAFLNPNIAAYTTEERCAVVYTKDGGSTWHEVANLPEPSQGGRIAVSADGSSMVWVPANVSGKPYVTFDFGETWYYCKGLGFGTEIAADRVNPKTFYATCDGQLYISKDGGVNFENTGKLVADSAVPQTVPGKEGHVWLATGSLIMYTEDGCETFQNVKTLSEIQAIGFGAGKNADSDPVVYALGNDGTNGSGIYRSEDKGETWVRINDDQHLFGNLNGKNGYISGDSNVYGRVYIATNGRGIIMGDMEK
ncbi:MAG: WD40/YVTN/BNR-like repeat-containing protein [Ruminococcus sp.]